MAAEVGSEGQGFESSRAHRNKAVRDGIIDNPGGPAWLQYAGDDTSTPAVVQVRIVLAFLADVARIVPGEDAAQVVGDARTMCG